MSPALPTAGTDLIDDTDLARDAGPADPDLRTGANSAGDRAPAADAGLALPAPDPSSAFHPGSPPEPGSAPEPGPLSELGSPPEPDSVSEPGFSPHRGFAPGLDSGHEQAPAAERDPPPAPGAAERADVRDVVAWTRLLADPGDAAAFVRALARPPIELRQVDLARVIQIARRRKLDMVAALGAAIEAPQLPPEARARVQRFLELHRAASEALDAARPDLLARAALGAERDRPRVGSAASPAAVARAEADGALRDTQRIVREEVLVDVARIGARLSELRLDTDLDIAHGVARYLELLKLSALAQRPAEQSVGGALADVNARLLAAATMLEREILQSSPLDAALLDHDRLDHDRPDRRRLAHDGLRREGSGHDGLGHRLGSAARVRSATPRGEPSLVPFLPRRGEGLALSASDIETYRGCPLRYKFARVLRIPTEPTVGQRFGIAVHQTLERYHAAGGETLAQLLDLFESCWRRGGLGGEEESGRELHEKARVALERYHARLHGQESRPVWFERQFSLRIGPHHLRGRVDRVDRLPAPSGDEREDVGGGEGRKGERGGERREGAGGDRGADERSVGGERYELIDYKTSRARGAEELREDIQLSLYALAARESWQVEAASRAYYYVLDDEIVRPEPAPDEERWVRDTVMEVGEGIMAQRFEPTPSRAACALCDFRIVCPAAER